MPHPLPYSILTVSIASLLAWLLIIGHVPTFTLQQIAAVLVLLTFLNLLRWGKQWFAENTLGLVTLLVQVLVVLSGGFYSPLIVLVHLTTFGLGMFFDLTVSVTFLTLTISVLVLQIIWDPRLRIIFEQDPWTAVLYAVSFVIVFPVTWLVVQKYSLKDKFVQTLKSYIWLQQRREEQILSGLQEMVVVMNARLKILSVNEAVRGALGKTNEDVLFKPLLEIVGLKDRSGDPATRASLLIDQTLSDGLARFMDGYFLDKRDGSPSVKIDLQVRAVENLDDESNMVVMIIRPANLSDTDAQHYFVLQRMLAKHDKLVRALKRSLIESGRDKLAGQVELLNETEHDLLMALELKEHAIDEHVSGYDVDEICRNEVQAGRGLAESLKVDLRYLAGAEVLRADTGLAPKQHLVVEQEDGHPYRALIDHLWFGLLLQKLIDILVLLASEEQDRQVDLLVQKVNSQLQVRLTATCPQLVVEHTPDLFTKYYGKLNEVTNLKYGSGLEGFLAKTIAAQLGIRIGIKFVHVPDEDPEARRIWVTLNLKTQKM